MKPVLKTRFFFRLKNMNRTLKEENYDKKREDDGKRERIEYIRLNVFIMKHMFFMYMCPKMCVCVHNDNFKNR